MRGHAQTRLRLPVILTLLVLVMFLAAMVAAGILRVPALLGLVLWTALAGSAVLTIWGIAERDWQLLVIAAVLSGVFSLFAILSIGPLVTAVTFLQIAAAIGLGTRATWVGWIALVLAAFAVWVALIGRILIPFWLGYR